MTRESKPLLRVNQWLQTWDVATWGGSRPKPPTHFYVGSLPLKTLRALSGVQPRTVEDRRASKTAGYQRTHDEDRLSKIGRYLEYGFPLSTEGGLDPEAHTELVNPGWLPTSILVNVLGPNEIRTRKGKERTVAPNDIVKISINDQHYELNFPVGDVDPTQALPPLEIVDGQHRLLATDLISLPDDYEVPVVIFDDLPLTWQAYLFWVINVEPKRINTSLAFDLYPELRDQEWLKRGESIRIYQEHRSQELAEVLWRNPSSPWKERIELFGKRVDGHVSNAAAIRSLMATFVRTWAKGNDAGANPEDITKLGGLFGSIDKNGTRYIIRWRRPEQAAFLILCWNAVRTATAASKAPWKLALAESAGKSGDDAATYAFAGPFTLLATDQGFRAVSFAYNSLTQLVYDKVGLLEIEGSENESEPNNELVAKALKQLESNRSLTTFVHAVATALVDDVDWRTSAAPGMVEQDKVVQGQYRGSSGYKALNKAALTAALKSNNEHVREAAERALDILGWGNE
ncbi:MAG: DGQHR domain-containing protein [Methylobacterium sp.]|jgi:DGQHR domain-containing protein|nr:DGQHR domain-containing protein [Methylobacterium sp.]